MKLIVSAMLAVSLFFSMVFTYDVSSEESLFENAEVIYVCADGNDKGDGSLNKPLATAKAARNMVRSKNTDKDLYVVFRGGEYNIKETLELNNQDSGKNGNRVIYMAYPGEEVIFNGGKKISGWKFYKDGIYEADVNDVDNFRELYVNGKRKQRASTKVIEGMGFDENQTAIKVLTADLPQSITNQDCLETINTYKWRQYWLPVKSVFKEGNYTKLYYDEAPIRTYTSRFNFEWTGKTYFRIENALEFLDEGGEWYFDKYKKKLYYKPETGEDIASSDIYAPVIEKFIDIKGEDVDKPIENIEIRNIKFLYGGWTYPSEEGYCSVQATSMVGENGGAYAAMTPGHIEVNYAKNIVFDGNTMAHMAAVGINLENAVTDSQIKQNVFYDIGASAVTVGSTKHDQVDRIREIPDNIITQNNIIRYAGMGFYGAPGIAYYYTTNSKIIHNDIQNITYSGISIGWGWKDTTIQHDNIIGYNKIGNINTKVIDGAGIYSLSRNDNSSYVGNYVFGVNAPFNSAALYHDQNSCGFDDYDNVIDAENPSFLMYNLNDNDNLVIRDTYTNTLNIINYKRENKDIKIYNIHYIKNDEWPERAKEIMDNSGPQKEYYDEVYKKLATVEKDVSVRKPILKAINSEYEEANLFYPICHDAANKEDIKAPYMEENGNVVIDAIDINGEYLGYDVSKKAFVGTLRNKEWVGDYTARAAITVQSCQYDIENAHLLTQKPRVGYKVYFSSAGKYHVFLRARVLKEMTEAVSVYLDDKEIGKLNLRSDFSWCNKTGSGELIADIPEAGVYEIKLETANDVYVDRLWLTQNPPEELYDGSVISGPYASDRYSQATEYVNVEKKLEELPPELTKRVNVALNKTATASSYLDLAPGYPPQKAVNGVFGDDWLTEKTNENAWWQVDLEKKYKITEIGLVFRTTANQEKTRRNFEVLASNDENFNSYTRLYTSEDLTVGFKEELSLPIETDESFQYIRVRKTALEPMGIAECRVYSEETNEFDISEAYYSSDKKGKYGVNKITDGNFSTYWSEGFKNNYWVKFKNKSDKALGKVQIYIRNDVNIPELYNDFEIRASNDYDFDSYVVLADDFLRKGNVLTATIKDPNSYKYIMVIKKQGFIGVSEVKLYERGSALEGE